MARHWKLLHFQSLELLRTHRLEIGAKLEVIDPLNPGVISVGRILRVLQNKYLMIGIDNATAADGSDEICVHATSPILLPAGYAEQNGLQEFFSAPYPNFTWEGQQIVPRELFTRVLPTHHFRKNQFLEVIGCSGTDLLYPGRVERVTGHLLRIHYEGYGADEDHFFPMCSPDIYPIGWAHAVGHRLITPVTGDENDNDGDENLDAKKRRTTTTRKRKGKATTHQG